ncbi:hypothetical protein AB0L64_28910 [Kribbella sp. NPDC051936]|uniref:sunset domain-containing protein n=1 Tax=Kribbella sp. NPDC051936 TaxID=3154946 RepID=UPI00342B8532
MSWLLRDNWIGSLLAFLLGAGITWYLLDRRPATATPPIPTPAAHEPPGAQEPLADGKPSAAQAPSAGGKPPAAHEPSAAHEPPAGGESPAAAELAAAEAPPADAPAAVRAPEKRAEFSQLMDGEPTLFDHIQPGAETGAGDAAGVPAGRYGEGSADAVPHQGPPDGFTIKGNAQSMLFHTPDSPYYGRTKPEVWFRTEADAERAGFTKYARRPRKAADPRE